MAWSGTLIKQPASPDSTISVAADSRFILVGGGGASSFYTLYDTSDDTSVAYPQGGGYCTSYPTTRNTYGGLLYITLAVGDDLSSNASLYSVDPYGSPGTLTLVKANISTGYRPSAMIGKYYGIGSTICDVTSGTTTTISSTYGNVRGAVGGYFICCQTGTTTAYLIKTDGTHYRTFTMRNTLANQYDTVLTLRGDWVMTVFMIIPHTTGMKMVNPFTDATLDVAFMAGLTDGVFTAGVEMSADANNVLYGSTGGRPIAVDVLTGRWEKADPWPGYNNIIPTVVGSNVHWPSATPDPWPGGW